MTRNTYSPAQRTLLAVAALLLIVLVLLFALLLLVGDSTSQGEGFAVPVEGSGEGDPVVAAILEVPGAEPFRPRGGAAVADTVYLADSEGGRLVVVDLGEDPAAVRFVPLAPDRPDEGMSFSPQPTGVAVMPGGDVLVPDPANGTVWRLRPDGAFGGSFVDEHEASQANLTRPVGITVGEDEIYVTDVGDHSVKVFAADGRFMRSFGVEGFRLGELSFPNAVAVGRDGLVYVADSNNRRVQVFAASGRPLEVLIGPEGSAAGGSGSSTESRLPRALAFDRFGRLHVLDTFTQRVNVFRGGEFLFSYGEEEPGGLAVELPEALAVSENTLVLGDTGNRRLIVYRY